MEGNLKGGESRGLFKESAYNSIRFLQPNLSLAKTGPGIGLSVLNCHWKNIGSYAIMKVLL